MILGCPACAIRYRVDEREFEGLNGRTVRCANCGHLWYETPLLHQTSDRGAPVDTAAVSLDAAADQSVEAARARIPQLEIAPYVRPSVPRASRRGRTVALWVVAVVVLLVAVALAGAVARREFAGDWPMAGRLHAVTGQPTSMSTTGLVIRKIAPKRTPDGLTVDGEIANLGDEARDLPRLRVELQNSAEKEIRSKTVDPPKTRLQPGEVVHFAAPFAHPPEAAIGVVVTFASP